MSAYEAMREAIEQAWSSTDPEVVLFQMQLFPKGKPTVEEFIRVLAEEAAKIEKRAN